MIAVFAKRIGSAVALAGSRRIGVGDFGDVLRFVAATWANFVTIEERWIGFDPHMITLAAGPDVVIHRLDPFFDDLALV